MRNDPLVRALALLELPPRRIAEAIGAGVVALGSGLALAALAAWLIARAWQMPPVLDLSVAVVSVRALGISRGVFRYLERLSAHDAALRGTTQARASIYRRLAEGNATAITGLRRGELLTRTGEDIDVVGAVFVRALLPIIVAVVLSAAAITLSAMISIPAAAVLAVALFVSGVLAPWYGARSAGLAEKEALAFRAAYAERAVVAIDNAAELQVAGRLDRMLGETRGERMRSVAAADRAARGSAISTAANPFAIAVSVVASLLFGILAFSNGAGMTPMALCVLVLLPLAAFEAVSIMPEVAQELIRARVAARRVMGLLDAADTDTSVAGTATVPSDITLRADYLSCGWPGGCATAAIDLTLEQGARIAVVGDSGSGKTTLLMTLAGIVPPARGHVKVNGQPIERLDPRQLRSRVTFFAEDAHLFDTSVLENLRVARGDLTEHDASEVLDAVGLGDWIRSLPEGLHTQLTGGPRAVSGGQRRRILLARALVSPAQVLLLDEPTEHLDAAEGAELLRRLLDRRSGLVAPDRTVVVVTHQLPADCCADQVHSVRRNLDREPGPISSNARPLDPRAASPQFGSMS
jgi:ATP-binding cassette, subfamily C, bacterial CydC